MFRLLIRVRLQSLYNVAAVSLRRSPPLSAAYALGGAFLFAAIFWGFRLFLRLGAGMPGGREQMVHDLFHFLFLFVIAGAVPFVASTLLQAGDYVLLSSAPIPSTAITAAKLLDATVSNSLQFTVIGLPAMSACGAELPLSLAGWLALALILALFLLLPAVFTALILLAALAAFGARRLRRIIAIANVVLATMVCLTMVVEVQRLPIRQALASWPAAPSAMPMGGPHSGPSGWFSAALVTVAHGDWSEASARLGELAALVAALFVACMLLGGRTLSAASLAEEGEGERPKELAPNAGIAGNLLPRVLSPPVAAMVAKDMRYTFRDSVLLGQLLLPVILYLVPFALAMHPAVRSLASWSEMGYVSVAMAAIVVYMQTSILSLSSVGLEGRSFWIPKASPNAAGVVVVAKFVSSLLISAGTGLALVMISGIVFAAPVWLVAVECGVTLLVCAALCGMGVGLSAMLPRFIYENPAHRVSVWALILGFVTSVVYVFGAVALFVVAFILAGQFPENARLFYTAAGALFLTISLIAATAPLAMGAQRLASYQWEH